MTTATKARERADLFTLLDRGISLVARIALRASMLTVNKSDELGTFTKRYLTLFEREARVRRLVREAVDRALIRAAQREGA